MPPGKRTEYTGTTRDEREVRLTRLALVITFEAEAVRVLENSREGVTSVSRCTATSESGSAERSSTNTVATFARASGRVPVTTGAVFTPEVSGRRGPQPE